MSVLALSGHIPEHIGDIVRFTNYSGERNITSFCGYASDFISQVLHDDTVNAAVYPRSCDSCRVITSYLENSGKRLYQFNIPQGRADMALDYYAKCLKDYSQWYYDSDSGVDEKVRRRTELINTRNAEIQKLYQNLEDISFYDYLERIHIELKKPLEEQCIGDVGIPSNNEGKRVYVFGSLMANTDIAHVIEGCGMNVVGDNLPESYRLAYDEVIPVIGDIYENIAASMLKRRLSPTQNDFAGIFDTCLDEIRSKGVKGVVFVLQKYCEPYDFLYSAFTKRLDNEGLPYTKISCLNSEDIGKSKLLLEAFSDVL